MQLSLIAIFLAHDLDCLVAVRTPPFNSWKNPAERVMFELNLAPQAVGLMRRKMSNELEKAIEGCNSMSAIRESAVSNSNLQGGLKDSLEPVIVLLCSLFQKLKLKDEPFAVFTSASIEEMDTLASALQEVEDGIDPTSFNRSNLPGFPKLNEFFSHCCQRRHYSFCIKKCGLIDCHICKPPRLPGDVFQSLHFIPDPVADGNVYKPFAEVHETDSSEKDRPSLNLSAEKQGHGIPFNPSGQFAKNVGRALQCTECGKQRVLHSARKLHWTDRRDLEKEVGDLMYMCGMTLQDVLPGDISPEAKEAHLLSRVFVRQNLSCNKQIETPFFSSACFEAICSYCGNDENLIPSTPDIYPMCSYCKRDPKKTGIL